MPKKEFKPHLTPAVTEKQLSWMLAPKPFGRCENCSKSIPASECYCGECLRLTEIGFGPTPRKPNMHVGQDTTSAQSYPSDKHAGYSDKIPTAKIPPTRERY